MEKLAHLESLVARIEALRGRFGRASADLEAICSRARSQDYRGVLQNSRVVVETLLRSILHKEKKETPGKDTLEKLIPKLFQEGQKSILPVAIVVHIRTIQAWGNVGAHDQHADLFEQGLEVKGDEALAALNSLVAILEWYQEKYLAEGATMSSPATPAKSAPLQPADPPRSRAPVFAAIGVLGVLALAGIGGAIFASRDGTGEVTKAEPDRTAEARANLNRAYMQAREYPPPKSCETSEPEALALFTEATELLQDGKPGGKRTEDAKALALLEKKAALANSAEYWYLKARALHFTGAPDAGVREAADRAIELCKAFAPPYNLHGTLGLLADELGFAKLSYQKAIELAPDYLSPAFNLGLVHLKSDKVEEAIAAFTSVLKKDPEYTVAYRTRAQAHLATGALESAAGDLDELTRRAPDDARAFFMLGTVRSKLGQDEAARAAFCKAKELGLESASKMCE